MAAIAILGTILVCVVMAKAGHTRQIALTKRTNAAVRAADELITRWWTSEEGVPEGRQGLIEGDESLAWVTCAVENREIEGLGGRVVRVEIREADPGAVRPDEAVDTLVTVDLVLPAPDRGEDTRETEAGRGEDAGGARGAGEEAAARPHGAPAGEESP